MSTATQTTAPAAETQTVDPALLEAAIAATERRQSLKEQAADYLQVPVDNMYAMLRHKWKTKKDEDPFTDGELFMGLSLIVKYDLDPMAKEIYLGRAKDGSLMIIIAIDGWIKIVHRTGDYNGHTQEMHFDEKGDLEWVDTTIYSRTREHPTVYRGFAVEYMRLGGFMKSSIPWHMLRLFSFRHAARFFAPIGGAIVTEEEAGWMRRETTGESPPADSLGDLTDELNAKAAADAPPEEPEPTAETPVEPEPTPEVDQQEESTKLCKALATRAKNAKTIERAIIRIETEAKDRKADGGLYPDDYDTVMAACLARRIELTAAE